MSFVRLKRSLSRRALGWKLTVWGAAVTLTVCLLVCGLLYAGVSISLRDQIDIFLVGEMYEFVATSNDYLGNDPGLEAHIRKELGSRRRNDLSFRLFDAEGALILTSDSDDVVAAEWQRRFSQSRPVPQPVYESLTPPGRPVPYRLCSQRVTLQDGRECIAQAGYRMERMDASLAEFRRICAAVLIISIAVALGAGRFLSRRGLRPIQDLATTARGVGAGKLDERMPISGSGDELDQLAGTLNDMLARIARYVKQLRQFTADASHELRTPLAALRGATEVALSRARSADELRQVLEDHLAHFDRLQRIAGDLLLLAQLDAGENVLARTRVDFNQAVSDVVDLYRPLAEDRSVQINLMQGTHVAVQGDAGRIKQLVCNLLDNAIKFTPGPGRIEIATSRDDRYARLVVRDTGVGINGDHVGHVFDRFFRADDGRSSTNGGTGLGLAICRSIAEAHGGRIDLQSQPGRGTTVNVTLPLTAAATGTPTV